MSAGVGEGSPFPRLACRCTRALKDMPPLFALSAKSHMFFSSWTRDVYCSACVSVSDSTKGPSELLVSISVPHLFDQRFVMITLVVRNT